MLKTNGKFYLGRVIDTQTGKPVDKALLYDPDDLTTHAVVVGMTSQAKSDIGESEDVIEELEDQFEALAEEMELAIDEVEEKWSEIASEIEEISVNPLKKDIIIELFGVAWMPYHIVDVEGQTIELPGFSSP